MALSISSKGNGRRNIPICILLDNWVYDADCPKATSTTAWSETSKGVPISVSLRAARPPALSHLAVSIAGREVTANLFTMPRVISADDGLFVLRVPRDLRVRSDWRYNDYFVYRLHGLHRDLHLLPRLRGINIADNEVAVLSCGDRDYVVAVLTSSSHSKFTFNLHLCRSTDGGKPGSWTSQVMSVEDPVRDTLYPIPDTKRTLAYHRTTKVITVGGDKGTVGWVDLWRGILLCDVLSETPKLCDMPLPLPSGNNWYNLRNCDPHFFRDISVNKLKNTIKFVEMDIRPRNVPVTISDSCLEPFLFVPGPWRATTYTMPIPVPSCDDWDREYRVRSETLDLRVEKHEKLLQKLIGSCGSKKQEATEATMSLERIHMAHPALSFIDDDIVYMLFKAPHMNGIKAVAAVDMRKGALQGLAKIDTNRHSSFINRCYLATGISTQHLLKCTVARALRQVKEHVQKPESVEENLERGRSDAVSTSDVVPRC